MIAYRYIDNIMIEILSYIGYGCCNHSIALYRCTWQFRWQRRKQNIVMCMLCEMRRGKGWNIYVYNRVNPGNCSHLFEQRTNVASRTVQCLCAWCIRCPTSKSHFKAMLSLSTWALFCIYHRQNGMKKERKVSLQPFENWSEINLMSVRFVWISFSSKVELEIWSAAQTRTIAIQQQMQHQWSKVKRKKI